MGIVDQGLASPTQPAEFNDDKNFDYTNTLPNVDTDAFIEGASNELNSEGDDADKWPAWRVGARDIWLRGVRFHGLYECRICMNKPEVKNKRSSIRYLEDLLDNNLLYRTEESLVSHLMEKHANP